MENNGTPKPRPVTLRDAEALVGLPYEPRTFDCTHLAALAQRKLWGRDVGVPSINPVHPRDQARRMLALRAQMADELRPEQATSGDVLLFVEAWPDLSCTVPSYHVGTLLVEGGERWLLHAHAGVGRSVLERLPDALRRGLRLAGYYRWRVVA